MDIQSKESINLIEYISDNFVGILLFFSVFLIIYCIDYVNYLNMAFLATQNPMVAQNPMTNMASQKPNKSISRKRSKK